MISENNPECEERGCVVATDSSNGEHFCLRCHKKVDLYNLGGIDTSKPADYAVVSRTHPIEEGPKLTKQMIDDLASNMGKIGDIDNMHLVEREYLEKLHDECSKVIALEYAVKVLAGYAHCRTIQATKLHLMTYMDQQLYHGKIGTAKNKVLENPIASAALAEASR